MNNSIVVIPTYNEIENIEAIIRKVFSLGHPFDVLIIDDGSPDGTALEVKKLMQEFPSSLHMVERKGKLGLGTAYIHGFKWALERGYDYIFEMDADFSHPPEDLIRLYNACAVDKHDVAIGSRYITGVNVVNWPINRVLMSYFAGYYVRMITGMTIMDPTAGFICYTRRVLETINLDSIRFIGYAFQIEMKFNSWKYGFSITEVPIIFTDRTKGASKMSRGIFKEAILGVISLKVNSFFKRYIPKNQVQK
ncbi:polyprenol monophosphomannose synthase [Dyadobacter luteus]|uniref:Polyprenol monophosphomannose synthase n=1 Tax=Dyadobacter luteus TaxID=2259619 RepID=A0A3D8Y4I7_9BACT|nr:polyprenol monophosphomannose synthase [Dyadobacter luteus]REA57266.1 polyprenol monophosphomannose synthase [Dyadobacter luteus]